MNLKWRQRYQGGRETWSVRRVWALLYNFGNKNTRVPPFCPGETTYCSFITTAPGDFTRVPATTGTQEQGRRLECERQQRVFSTHCQQLVAADVVGAGDDIGAWGGLSTPFCILRHPTAAHAFPAPNSDVMKRHVYKLTHTGTKRACNNNKKIQNRPLN